MSGKLDIRTFGDRLIQSGDLDPAYIGLHGAALPRSQLSRWLLTYWCFYHVGSACWMSEQEGANYWYCMIAAARNEIQPHDLDNRLPGGRWPRAAERRHFRGQKCMDAVQYFRSCWPDHPENLVGDLIVRLGALPPEKCTEKVAMDMVQRWPMFGPWIAFKAADMLERVAGVKIKFDQNLGLMYKEPRAALDLLVVLGTSTNPADSLGDGPITSGIVPGDWSQEDWYNNLTMYFHRHLAPPARDRTCQAQEVETVLCKWKSYMGGHYWLGKDTTEHREALEGWGETAAQMLRYMPRPYKEER